MEYRVAPGNRGLAWFRGGVRMLDRNPQGLVAVALGMVLLQQLPGLLAGLPAVSLLLSVVFLLLLPALMAGVQFAIAEAFEGRPVSPRYLFEGLLRPRARAQLVILGMITLVVVFAIGWVVQGILGPDALKVLVRLANQQVKPESAEFRAIVPQMLRAMGAAAAILFVWFVGLFFAVPRVMFDGRNALAALVESYAACAANVLALTAYGLLWVGVAFLAVMGLSVVSIFLGLLGQAGVLLVYLVAIAVFVVAVVASNSGNYLAWREVFGRPDTTTASPPQAGIIVV